MAQPSSEDMSAISGALDTLLHWGPISALALFGGYIWRVSARITGFSKTVDTHDKKIDEHEKEIEELKRADANAAVVVAALPRREDIRDLRDEMRAQAAASQAQMQSGFENIVRIIEGRRQ